MEGGCLCGAVRFRGEGEARGAFLCHCRECRRWCAGPFMVMVFGEGVTAEAGETLAWYASSDHGERGFCSGCGSTLFWRQPGEARRWGVSVNALDEDPGLAITGHYWVGEQPGWYAFADAAPRHEAGSGT